MATSTFGKATPFHATPSTCYPPPPPPPLPYDVPCLKGPTTLRLNQRGWIRFEKTLPGANQTLQIPTSGLPSYGSTGNDNTWTLNLSNAQLVWCKIQLICHKPFPFIQFWLYTIDGLAIMPDGTFCPFTRRENVSVPIDTSIPGAYNDIRIAAFIQGSNAVPWNASLQQQQWYTTGAPPMPPGP